MQLVVPNIVKIKIAILFGITLFGQPILAESADTTVKKIEERIELIKASSELVNIDYRILCSIIYTERTLNFNWEDEAFDMIGVISGLNSSMGFCQIKIKTAYWIEKQLNNYKSIFYSGDKYKDVLSISSNKNELIVKIVDDKFNILYAAAYLRIMISRWEKEKVNISNRPDILATLYSTGLFYQDGTERFPNSNPKANDFGKKAMEIFNQVFFKYPN